MRAKAVLITLLLTPILLCGCNSSKEESPYEAALVESQTYVATVSRLIRDMPKQQQEVDRLSQTHRDLLAAEGTRMTPEKHKAMVKEKSASLPEPGLVMPLKHRIDRDTLPEEQSALREELKKVEQFHTILPAIVRKEKERLWLEAEIAKLKTGDKAAEHPTAVENHEGG